MPFINASIPAVLTIEGSDSANGNVHTANDTISFIDYGLAMDIVRLNVAAAAEALEIADGAAMASSRYLGSGGGVGGEPAGRVRDRDRLGTVSQVVGRRELGAGAHRVRIHGGICTTRPEAVAWGPNRLDVFRAGHGSRALSQVVGRRELGARA